MLHALGNAFPPQGLSRVSCLTSRNWTTYGIMDSTSPMAWAGYPVSSPSLLLQSWASFKLTANRHPSISFVLVAVKGFLTVSPTSAARELHLRYSQYKFPAIHEGLEIIQYSQYTCAKLNRQLILVLSSLGVVDEIFRDKLKAQLEELRQAMTDPRKALYLLQKYVDHNQTTLTLAGMITDGFQDSGEPFTLALLQLWRAWSIKYLKEKAQIAVDGALLLGCVDETNKLRGHYKKDYQSLPGPSASVEERSQYLPQIFVQLSRDQEVTGSTNPKVILGPVLLTRSPMLHPGDVRVACCVDVPELHHIKGRRCIATKRRPRYCQNWLLWWGLRWR